jgi:hypothetical protein
VRAPAAAEQAGGDGGAAAQAHEHDDGEGAGGEGVQRGLPGAVRVAGDDHEARRQAAMGDRDSGQGGRGHGRADAGHDLERDAGLGERERLLASAAEHEGIAALEAHDALAALGGADHDAVDLLLGDVMPARALPHVEALGLARELQDGGVHEGVVEDEVGLGQPRRCLAREQLRISGAGPDEGDEPAHCGVSA